MEETILKTLQFQIRFVDVPFFLERFKRLFDLDRTDNRSVQISQMAGRFSKFALREGQFLDFKPSQIAAACLILACNISYSDVAIQIGWNKLQDPHLLSIQKLNQMGVASNYARSGAFRMWDKTVKQLTMLSSSRDIKPAYVALINSLNSKQYNGMLSSDPTLFETRSPQAPPRNASGNRFTSSNSMPDE